MSKFSLGRAAVNIEPTMCNGHLSYPWGRRWREGSAWSWMQGVGVSEAKRLGEGRGGSEGCWRVGS